MDNKKKIIVVVLIISTLILGGASIFISQQLQNTQAPTSSSADVILGTQATNSTLVKVNKLFGTTDCSTLLSNDTIAFYSPDNFTEIKNIKISYVESFPVASTCTAFLSTGEQIDMSINLYDPSTTANLATTENEVNAVLADPVIKSASVSFSPYFYGPLKADPNTCQTNIFSRLDDFKNISLTYKNFKKSCADLTDFTTQITFVVGKAANNLTLQAKENL